MFNIINSTNLCILNFDMGQGCSLAALLLVSALELGF
jgi:hypothetical protein